MRYASIKAAILIAAGILGLCGYFASCSAAGPVGLTANDSTKTRR